MEDGNPWLIGGEAHFLKDDIANQVFPSIQKLRAGMKDTLRRFSESASTVLRLIGREWFAAQLNALPKSQLSF